MECFAFYFNLQAFKHETRKILSRWWHHRWKMRGLGKFSHEGLHPLMECNLLFAKIFHLSSKSLNFTFLMFFFPSFGGGLPLCVLGNVLLLTKKIWLIHNLLESKKCNFKDSKNYEYVTNDIQFRKYPMQPCLFHLTVTGKLTFQLGGRLMTIYFALSSWHFSSKIAWKDQSRRGFLLYNLLLRLSTSEYHLFEQQYPQNINSVQENMSYGTSENSYKK